MSPIWQARRIVEIVDELLRLEAGDPQQQDKPWQRRSFLQFVTVVTALLIAVVGLFDGCASRGVDNATLQVHKLGVNMTAAFRHAQQEAQVKLETFALAQESRIRQANVQQQLILTKDLPTKRKLEQDFERWRTLAQEMEARSEIVRGTANSPEQDPNFPARFFATTWRDRGREFALQDAAIEEFAAWRRRVDMYAAALPMLGVALALFGLALGARTDVRNAFFWVGFVLLVGGTVIAAVISVPLDPPAASPRMRDQAKAAADAFGSALTTYEQADYEAAKTQFEKVTRIRPSFAYAYFYSAEAAYSSGSRVAAASKQGVTRGNNLKESMDYLLLAEARHLRDEDVLRALGNDYFQLAMRQPAQVDRSKLLQQSIDATSAALEQEPAHPKLNYNPFGKEIEIEPSDPLVRFNLGVAFLAEGRTDKAREEITKALRSVKKKSKAWEEGPNLDETTGRALTNLTKLLKAYTGLSTRAYREMDSRVTDMKELIIRELSDLSEPSRPPTAAATALQIDISPDRLRWRARLPGFQSDHDVLFVIWYYLNIEERAEDQEWSVLTDVSGRTLTLPNRMNDKDEFFDSVPYIWLTSPHRCAASGQYRVELYVNGRRVGSTEALASFKELKAAISPDQRMAMCRPEAWAWSKDKSVPGFTEGYVSPDRTSGAFIYRYQHARLREKEDEKAITKFYIDRTFDDLRMFFPKKPSAGKCKASRFGTLQEIPHEWYRSAGVCALVSGNVRGNGSVVVRLVFGPAPSFGERELIDVFESLTTFYEWQ